MAVAVATALAAGAEVGAHRYLATALSAPGTLTLDVAADGVRFGPVVVARGPLRIEVDRVRAGWSPDGLFLQGQGGKVTWRPPSSSASPTVSNPRPVPPAQTTGDGTQEPARSDPPGPLERILAQLDALRLPVRLVVTDLDVVPPQRWSHARLTVHVHAAELERRPGGDLRLAARARIGIDGASPGTDLSISARGTGPKDAKLRLQLTTEGRVLAGFSGKLADGLEGRLHVAGGTVAMQVRRPAGTDLDAAMEASNVDLAETADLLRSIFGRELPGPSAGILDGRVHLSAAHEDRWFLDVERLAVRGLVLHVPAASSTPLAFSPLRLEGHLARHGTQRSGAAVWTHGRITAEGTFELAPDRLAVSVSLPPTDCQVLLDDAPGGLLPHLRGAVVDGTLAGRATLVVDPRIVGSARQDPSPDLSVEPGVLEVHLPFATACRMLADPPGIDVPALLGPYVHRFRGDDGRLRSRVLAPGERDFVPLARAGRAAQALVVTEDSEFFRHDGFDYRQMRRAFWHNLLRGRVERGASTITQQLARNLWLGGERTLGRKLEEAVLAARLEQVVDKRRILEAYVNVVELGPEVYGVGQAARHHFGKAVWELSWAEAVYLATLAPAPRTLSLRHHAQGIPDDWRARVNAQARRLALRGMMTWSDYRAVLRSPLRLTP